MKYKLVPKASIITSRSPEEHKTFLLMDKYQEISIAKELRNRHLFLQPYDLLEITEKDKEIYFSDIPIVDKPREPQPPAERKSLYIESDYKNSRIGTQITW